MSDTDTDADLVPNNVLTFQNQGTIVSAKGPNINSTNISSLSFRNNVMTSTMHMPWNVDRPRYAESVCDQRSMYYNRERETSPMSFHSASGMQPRNLHHSYYPGTKGSYRSMYNGRSGSPTMSVRTFDSNTSMSVKDVAFAFQNGTFNKFDFQIIKDAFNRYNKHRSRKRVEKRRNVRMFLKGFRRKSGGDSGDQASNSSISSDDCRSTKTCRSTIYKENMSSRRSTKTDISDFRRTMRESDMVRDCSDNFRQNSFKSMFSADYTRQKENRQNMQQRWQNGSMTNTVTQLQKDRFRSGFQLPSQRFNQSIASLPIPENSNRLQRINEGNMLDIRHSMPQNIVRETRKKYDTDSDQDEIFADVTVMKKTSAGNVGKRILEGNDIPIPENKRTRLSPPNNNPKPKTPKPNQTTSFTKQKSNDFVFAKPQLPLKKPTITKQQKLVKSTQTKLPKEKPVKLTEETKPSESVDLPVEKVISSSQKVIEKLISSQPQPEKTSTEIKVQNSTQINPQAEVPLPIDITQNTTTDLSMRPSFIKRKLFTQKVVADKNSSSDSLQTESPQTNIYSKIQKEKHRARKLVTTQSCLNRDVADDSNLLDLIHRIVPAERMNVTTAANKTELQNNKSKPTNADKFDVTSLITTCNNSDNVSDTFTDEEIFAGDDSQKQQKEKPNKSKKDEKQLEVNKQTVQKPMETKKKATSYVKNKNPGKEQNFNNNAIKITYQNNDEKQKETKSNEQQKKRPVEKNKDTVIAKVHSNNDVSMNIQSKPDKHQGLKVVRSPECKVVIEGLQTHNFKEPARALIEPNSPTERLGLIKSNIYKGVKLFWDTDTESDLEATPLKIVDPKNTVAPPMGINAEVPVKKVTAPVTKVNKPQINKVPQNKTKPTQVKTAANQKLSSTVINKENNKTEPKNINKSSEEVHTENKPVQKGVAKTKTKTTEKAVNSKKAIPASRKENNPPIENSKEAKNKLNATLKSQRNSELPQIKASTKKTTSKNINNNDSTLSNNESQHIKIHNNTLRIRAQRKAKVKKNCGEHETSHLSVTNNNTTLCRSLRSREVDLSTSLKSDDGNVTATKKTTAVNKKPARNNKITKIIADKTVPSDVSFTLATDVSPSNRTLRNKKTSALSKEQKLRQSDVSFTLASENKSLNDTISTRSSRRNKELESLQNNSISLFKTGKRSPLCKRIAAESRAINKSSNMRLNRSRRLL